MSEEKKIIIDEDWKAQVEREKQMASQSEAAPSGAPQPPEQAGGEASPVPPAGAEGSDIGASADLGVGDADNDPPMPPASIGMLMSSLASEALFSMGQFPHPVTGKTEVRRNQAKYLIDTLAMIKEKTAGNLTSDEATALDDVVHQLRMAFVATKK